MTQLPVTKERAIREAVGWLEYSDKIAKDNIIYAVDAELIKASAANAAVWAELAKIVEGK